MSGYRELRDLGIQFGPFDGPPPPSQHVDSPFDASWSATVTLLAQELRMLEAQQIVIEIDGLGDADIRNDGLPRAQARLGDAVRLSFNSKHGPLRYETGRFTRRYYRSTLDGWQANLRAIALGLEALRKVDRYGITKRGEQYSGWRQLPVSTDPAHVPDAATARGILDGYGGVAAAIKATHPDTGGDPDEFRKVMAARELLGV